MNFLSKKKVCSTLRKEIFFFGGSRYWGLEKSASNLIRVIQENRFDILYQMITILGDHNTLEILIENSLIECYQANLVAEFQKIRRIFIEEKFAETIPNLPYQINQISLMNVFTDYLKKIDKPKKITFLAYIFEGKYMRYGWKSLIMEIYQNIDLEFFEFIYQKTEWILFQEPNFLHNLLILLIQKNRYDIVKIIDQKNPLTDIKLIFSLLETFGYNHQNQQEDFIDFYQIHQDLTNPKNSSILINRMLNKSYTYVFELIKRLPQSPNRVKIQSYFRRCYLIGNYLTYHWLLTNYREYYNEDILDKTWKHVVIYKNYCHFSSNFIKNYQSLKLNQEKIPYQELILNIIQNDDIESLDYLMTYFPVCIKHISFPNMFEKATQCLSYRIFCWFLEKYKKEYIEEIRDRTWSNLLQPCKGDASNIIRKLMEFYQQFKWNLSNTDYSNIIIYLITKINNSLDNYSNNLQTVQMMINFYQMDIEQTKFNVCIKNCLRKRNSNASYRNYEMISVLIEKFPNRFTHECLVESIKFILENCYKKNDYLKLLLSQKKILYDEEVINNIIVSMINDFDNISLSDIKFIIDRIGFGTINDQSEKYMPLIRINYINEYNNRKIRNYNNRKIRNFMAKVGGNQFLGIFLVKSVKNQYWKTVQVLLSEI